MKTNRLVNSKEINSLIKSDDFAGAASHLLKLQRENWKELDDSYSNLELIKTKTIWFDGFKINLQYNPDRIKSTSAKVNIDAIKRRECFLCDNNLPSEQKGIEVLGKYLILCNPYPVFPEHFTIAASDHKPQEILKSFYDFLLLTKMMGSKFTSIYNGPKCGASAPDHLHFQTGTKNFMPIENDFCSLKNEYGEIICENDTITVTGINDSIRKFISLESKNETDLTEAFSKIYEIFSRLSGNGGEPRINLICNYNNETGWRVIMFLRGKHRSSHYYFKGKNRVLVSPAAIDLGGICITPIQNDFDRIEKDLITDICNEVFISKEAFEYIKSTMKKNFTP